MGRAIILGIAMAALWLLLSGYFDHPLLLAFGVLSVVLSVWLSARVGVLDDEGVPTSLMPGIFGYWLWLFLEIGKANVAVARQAMAINPAIAPVWIKVPLTQKTNVGIATFANSITLTPGTVSVDLEPDHILVHGLTPDLADETGIVDMGRRINKLERP